VTVTQAEYDKMQRELGKLYALEAGGVDNWEWFDESLKEWRKENEFNEMIDDLVYEFGEVLDNLASDAEVDFPGGYECGPNVYIQHDEDQFKTFINLVINKYKGLQSNDQ
jgi:hypothetical protein